MDPQKTKYKYVHFVKVGDSGKTQVWDCYNSANQYTLGRISYLNTWRQYIFSPNSYAYFSVGCMEDICNFISQLEDIRKTRREEEKCQKTADLLS